MKSEKEIRETIKKIEQEKDNNIYFLQRQELNPTEVLELSQKIRQQMENIGWLNWVLDK